MVFKWSADKTKEEEIIATVHEWTPLIEEIEKLVLRENITNQMPGYAEDEIVMLDIDKIECFYVDDEKTYMIYEDGKRYFVKKRLYELALMLPKEFERISKSAIANWKRISRFKLQLSGAVNAVFKSGYTECISRRCFADLKRRYGL